METIEVSRDSANWRRYARSGCGIVSWRTLRQLAAHATMFPAADSLSTTLKMLATFTGGAGGGESSGGRGSAS